MKTYTLTYKSSREATRFVVVMEAKVLPHVITHARQNLDVMHASMAEGETLTYTIHRNGELVWEESCTK